MGCDPKEIALKSLFLGPQAENGVWVKPLVGDLFESWFTWRKSRFPEDGAAISAEDMQSPEFQARRKSFETGLHELISRFEGEVPKFSPRYVGHMFSEISLPALLGHVVALLHNPNNISGESSRVGVAIEDEALQSLQRMLGFGNIEARGHFTSGGTLANFEALVRARARMAHWLAAGAASRESQASGRDLFSAAHQGWGALPSGDKNQQSWDLFDDNPWEVGRKLSSIFGTEFRGPVVLIPENKHYSWKKGVSLVGIGAEALWPIELDHRGKLSIPALRRLLECARTQQRPVLMVVSVAGSTELGTIDPTDEVQDLLDEWASRGYHIWHHVDAAYGGFFCSMNLAETEILDSQSTSSLAAIRRANSVTLDPHKLGYVPYSCGAFLCRDQEDYSSKEFGAPYVQTSTSDRGPYTLEGSRAATGATATWMTAKSIGFDSQGYGRVLERAIRIKQSLEKRFLKADSRFRLAPHTDTNILAFSWSERGAPLSEANTQAERIYQALSPQGGGPFFVSKTRLFLGPYRAYLKEYLASFESKVDTDEMTLVRVCIMNPFFGSIEMKTRFEVEFVKSLLKIIGVK